MDSSLQGGTTRRNDTADGRVTYTFRCNSGYQLIGHAVISCSLGQWNGSKPKCIVQGNLKPQILILRQLGYEITFSVSRLIREIAVIYLKKKLFCLHFPYQKSRRDSVVLKAINSSGGDLEVINILRLVF